MPGYRIEACCILAGEPVVVHIDASDRIARAHVLPKDVVGFYTPGYLASKFEALRAVASRPIVVRIDESLACADGDLPGAVLPFKRRIDAQALVAFAERFCERR